MAVMKLVLLTCCVLLVAGVADASKVTPIQKVLQMMQDMLAKGKQEKASEEVRFAAFSSWCASTRSDKQNAIQQEKDDIESLAADIDKATADIAEFTTIISNLESDVAAWTHNKKAAAGVRSKEKADFQALHKDYSESIDALERAINVLKKQNVDRKQAKELLQEVAALGRVPVEAKNTIAAFMQQQPEGDSFLAAPEANAYEFQSGGVVEMLEKLHHKFIAELRTAEKEEMNISHAYKVVDQDLTGSIENAEEEIGEKKQEKARTEQALATAKGDKEDTEKDLSADTKYLSDLLVQCADKANAYEQRQKLRADEIEAIGKAMEIIASPDVSGAGKKHLPQLAQTDEASSFVQVSVSSPQRKRIAALLQAKAHKLGSRVLAMVAVKVAEDPFKDVKKMIQNMIVKLMEEANAEASHKGWCDTELGKNTVTREQKTSAIEKLSAQVAELQSTIETLSTQVTELSNAVAALQKNMHEATEERDTDKAKNTKTIAEAQVAEEAVARALQVLKDFYAKASDATALVQGPAEDAPETFDSSFKGQQSSSGGIVGMLEVIQSDFSRLETETKSAEDQAQNEYDEFMQDSKTDVAVKKKSIELKEGEKQTAVEALASSKSDLGSNQEELDAALAYYEKLRPSCVDSGLSYEERVQARKEEIESLQEALSMLSGEA